MKKAGAANFPDCAASSLENDMHEAYQIPTANASRNWESPQVLNRRGRPRKPDGPYNLAEWSVAFAKRTSAGLPLALREIADQMGVTHQYAQYIRKKFFPSLVSQTAVRREMYHLTHLRNPYLFQKMIQKWLKTEGYFLCFGCKSVKCWDKRTKGVQHNICKRCTADSANAAYHRKRHQDVQ